VEGLQGPAAGQWSPTAILPRGAREPAAVQREDRIHRVEVLREQFDQAAERLTTTPGGERKTELAGVAAAPQKDGREREQVRHGRGPLDGVQRLPPYSFLEEAAGAGRRAPEGVAQTAPPLAPRALVPERDPPLLELALLLAKLVRLL